MLINYIPAPSGYQLEDYMVPDKKRGSISTKAPKAFAKYAKKAQSGE